MKDYKNKIRNYYDGLIKTVNNLDLDEINQSMNAIMEAYERDANIYICGNGGSAATASHFQNDFNKGISERLSKKFNFVCLNDNIATIMAIANDSGYDEVFSMQLEGKIKSTDLLIAISGSGNSKNIIRAVEHAKSVGAKVIGVSGFDGGKLRKMADYNMHADIMCMQITEDIHMTFDHMMMKIFMGQLTESIQVNLDHKMLEALKA